MQMYFKTTKLCWLVDCLGLSNPLKQHSNSSKEEINSYPKRFCRWSGVVYFVDRPVVPGNTLVVWCLVVILDGTFQHYDHCIVVEEKESWLFCFLLFSYIYDARSL